jgi:hypothetical protein
MFSAILALPPDPDEMMMAGFLRGSPVEMVKCQTAPGIQRPHRGCDLIHASSGRQPGWRPVGLTAAYSPCSVPHTDTSSPISRNMAALVASARLAASASGA